MTDISTIPLSNDAPMLLLSNDASVFRRFNIGYKFASSEIPFFAPNPSIVEHQSASVYRMCGDLGAGGGSIRYMYTADHTQIFTSYITIYPLVLHHVKLHLRGRKTLPSTIQGLLLLLYYWLPYCMLRVSTQDSFYREHARRH